MPETQNNDASSISSWASFGASRISHLDRLSASSSVAVLDEARVKLEQEIEAICATAATMRMRRNSLLPIARLHPEVLAHIFSFLAADETEIPRNRGLRYQYGQSMAASQENSLYDKQGWIRVTHVCRHWRHVALDHPGLWGIDISSFPAWTDERMRRSKHAPIDITYSFVQGGTIGAMKDNKSKFIELLSALGRTRELTLRQLNHRDIGELSPFLLGAAPLLESFSCDCPPAPKDPSTLLRLLPLLPSNLFDGETPRLYKLALTDVLISLKAPLYDSVVDLSLLSAHPSGFVSPNFTRDQLLSLFGRMPRLQSLEIKYMIPCSPVQVPSTSSGMPPADLEGRVSLPRLRSLKVSSDIQDCVWLSQTLSLPPSVTLHLSCSNEANPPVQHYHTLLSLVASHMHGDNSTVPIKCLSMNFLPNQLYIEGWRAFPEHLFSLSRGAIAKLKQPEISVDFTGYSVAIGTDKFKKIVRHFCEEPFLDKVAALDVSTITVGMFPFVWRDFFTSFAAVQQLAVSGAVVELLINELSQNPYIDESEGPDWTPKEWLFPGLRRLKLCRADFWNYDYEEEEEELCTNLVGLLEDMQECPTTNIEELVVQDCGIQETLIKDLRDIVPTVTWDDSVWAAPRLPQDPDEDEEEDEEGYGGEEYYGEDWDDEPNFFDENPDVDIHDIFHAFALETRSLYFVPFSDLAYVLTPIQVIGDFKFVTRLLGLYVELELELDFASTVCSILLPKRHGHHTIDLMSSSRKRKYRPRTSADDAYAYPSWQPAPEASGSHMAEPDPALFIVAYEADLVRGPQAISAAQSLEVDFGDTDGDSASRETARAGGGLIKWERTGADDGGDVWVDRYDARLLLDTLPRLTSIPPSSRPQSPSGWSDLPSDAEDTFFFTPEEAEDYHREKRRRIINQLREDRLKAREAEEDDDDLHSATERWGGSDEEPEEAQRAVMRRTATHLVASPNVAQLEMRILANHGADPRFAFLRGRWVRAWAVIKAEARRDAEEKSAASDGKGLGGIMSYEDSDEESEAADGDGGEGVKDDTQETQQENKEDVSAEGDDEVAIKEARRARAREWMKQRRAQKDKIPESGANAPP
ncbi:hypothetical protein EVG20_g1630 [Dentipellis fragilis]|uniref:Uncharacterized protein n=1 Tax=Dentipellis fragilis TaxID=205917 RepID=A0A4Y9ZB41_9AGAM|nr:hypothetical protein EVG20_g1630 [Dentipellis fragilis]